MTYIRVEIASVSRVFSTRQAWGAKLVVEQIAARTPIKVVASKSVIQVMLPRSRADEAWVACAISP
jgi:hypothetical protein